MGSISNPESISGCYNCHLRKNINVTRRQLWDKLCTLQLTNPGPQNFIGGFNVLLSAHITYGRYPPKKTFFDKFRKWNDDNELIYLNINGSFYTWNNGIKGGDYVAGRLGRSVFNQLWLKSLQVISCTNLTKKITLITIPYY